MAHGSTGRGEAGCGPVASPLRHLTTHALPDDTTATATSTIKKTANAISDHLAGSRAHVQLLPGQSAGARAEGPSAPTSALRRHPPARFRPGLPEGCERNDPGLR